MNRLVFLATHWVNQNSNIYGKIGEMGWLEEAAKNVGDALKKGFTNILQDSTDFLGDALRWVVTSLGLVLETLLGVEGIDLTSIIYGRLLNGVDVNKFAFELAPGNTYGIVGAMSYSVLRTAVISFMVIVAAFLLCKGIWLGNGEKALAQFRSSLGNYLICAALLFLMPHVFEILTYVKDLLLYAGGSLSGVMQTGDYLDGYRKLATSVDGLFDKADSIFQEDFWTEYKYTVEGSFFAGCMYLGMVCMTIYLAYTYVTNAISQMIAFIMFPLVALVSIKDTKTLSKWFSSVVAMMAVPIVDSVLFAIPTRFADEMDKSGAYSGSILLFLVCMALLPARKVVRSWIGGETFSSASGMAALLMVGRLAAQAAGAAKNYSSSMADAGADRQRAKMYRELAGDPKVRITDGGVAAMSMSGGTGVNAKVSEFTSERAKKMAGLANVDNFENEEFANVLSDDQRAHFYEQRAGRAEAKARGAVFGGAIGGLGGFGATMFGGPAVQAAGVSMGVSLGGAIGAKVSGRKTVPYQKPEELERVPWDVMTKEEFENAFSGDDDQYYEFKPKQNLRAIGSGPIKMEEKQSTSRAALPNGKMESTVRFDVGEAVSEEEANAVASGETVSKIGSKQYDRAVEVAFDSLSVEEAFRKLDRGDMSGVEDVKDEMEKAYRGQCYEAGFRENTLIAMDASMHEALNSVFAGFSGDSKKMKAVLSNGSKVAGDAGLGFEELGRGLDETGFDERFDSLFKRVGEQRVEGSINMVRFAKEAAAVDDSLWDPDDWEAQEWAIRQTAVGYVNRLAVEVVEEASPNSLQVDKEAEAALLTKEFCYGFGADDLCKILGVNADLVRGYRPW